MTYPNFREEKKLYKSGNKIVVGIDEVGRGPLAGPVIACAITVPEFPISNFQFLKIRDSKKLTLKQREEIYELFKKDFYVKWGIGSVSEKVIDKINILEATKLAMKRAVANLEKKIGSADYLLIDGNFKINLSVSQKSIIKGDQKVFSIALASIIAKVKRDRLMMKYHLKYPEYGFNNNMGYGTRFHREAIRRCGLCNIHRKTFKTS